MKLGIALAAGAALGAAHVGVLKRLKEENIVPDILVGASVGAMVSGIYAAGDIDEFEYVVQSREFENALFDFNSLASKGDEAGFIAGDKLLELLRKLTRNKNFEDTEIKIAFNAVDINTNEHVTLSKGNIAEAIRASCSIPLVFKPYKIGERYLVDGGIHDQMPISLAKSLGAEVIIGVNFNRDLVEEKYFEEKNIKKYTYDAKKLAPNSVQDMIQEFPYIGQFLVGNKLGKNFFEYLKIENDKLQKILHLLRESLYEINYKEADAIIAPDITMFQSANVHKLKEIFEKGYGEADKLIKEIKNMLEIARAR